MRRTSSTGKGDRLAALTDGAATIAGRQRHWSTVGIHQIAERRIPACRLLPLDPAEFDDKTSEGFLFL